MTTPPDTPKPPVTMQEAVAWIEQLGHDSGTGPQREACYMLANAGRQFSPQESHKLAEELERLAVEFRFCSTDLGNAFALARFASDNALALLAALRSSPSEQDARELSDDLKMIDDTLTASGKESPFKPLWHASWRRIKVVVRAAIAASGGAKGDGNG